MGQWMDFTAGSKTPFALLGKLIPVHPGEDLPVELLRRNGVERNGLDGSWPAIGHHAPDDTFGLLDQTADRFIR